MSTLMPNALQLSTLMASSGLNIKIFDINIPTWRVVSKNLDIQALRMIVMYSFDKSRIRDVRSSWTFDNDTSSDRVHLPRVSDQSDRNRDSKFSSQILLDRETSTRKVCVRDTGRDLHNSKFPVMRRTREKIWIEKEKEFEWLSVKAQHRRSSNFQPPRQDFRKGLTLLFFMKNTLFVPSKENKFNFKKPSFFSVRNDSGYCSAGLSQLMLFYQGVHKVRGGYR